MQRHVTSARNHAEAPRRGLAPVSAVAARIMTEWPAIVGPALAQHSAPERLARPRDANSGVLHLRIGGAWALEFQHLEPRLVERINAYFGYPAVSRIRLIQAPLPQQRPTVRRAAVLALDQQAAIEALIKSVDDPTLRATLASLGRAIAHRGSVVATGPRKTR